MQAIKVLAEVILHTSDGLILILKRSDNDNRRPGQWDIPGGHVEEGEDLSAAAVRETKEETGLEIAKSLIRLDYTYTKPWDTSSSCSWLFFSANVIKQEPVLSHEHADFAWVGLDEAIDMIDYDLQKTALRYLRDNRLLG